MTILKTKSSKKVHFLGHNVDESVYQYFSLYAVANHVTKSSMFHHLVMDWMNENRKEQSDEALIARIILDLRKTFKYKKIKVDIEDFKEQAKEELLSKGISLEYVQQIVDKLK
jgi:hypothetical protein